MRRHTLPSDELGQLRITFDGDGLSSIDVIDLAPAPLGLGEIADAINAEVGGVSHRLRLRVRTGFHSGSFSVDLDFIRAGYQRFIELLNNKQSESPRVLRRLLPLTDNSASRGATRPPSSTAT